MAFVFLNRYLDLTEAMDDADAGPLENADFVDTDIPFDFHIPSKHYVPEAMRQQVPAHPVTVQQSATAYAGHGGRQVSVKLHFVK